MKCITQDTDLRGQPVSIFILGSFTFPVSKADLGCKFERVFLHKNIIVQGWGSWGSFGMGSLLSTATESVSALSSHVTAGLSTVTSVLDSSLGAPNPEDLAKTVREEEVEKQKSNEYLC